ncbi:MAG: hypothetical protein QOK04_741 [Solirubrobacteraceae bacterium]|nr:hypothetical protein [Solirubrobacteraceae bacterium]
MNRDQERLEDILEYTRLIRRHTASGRSALDDEVTQAAVTRCSRSSARPPAPYRPSCGSTTRKCRGGTWWGCATSWCTPTGG